MKKKKILIISTEPTHPPFAGNRSAILGYSELLANLGHDVEFLLVHTSNKNEEKFQTSEYWGKKLHLFETNGWFYRKWFYRKLSIHKYIFNNFTKNYKVDNWYPPRLHKTVKNIVMDNNIDVVIVNYIWLTKIFNYVTNVKKILFTHDVFSNRFTKTGIRWFSVSPSEETKALNRCDVVLAIQEQESLYFRSITKSKVVTTYSPVKFTNTKFCNNRNLLFLAGPNDYNTQGLIYFIEKMWPNIKKEFPTLKLLVGGRICKRPEIQNYDNDIKLLGEISELIDFYSKGDIIINPVFEGTGLKIKNIEALSFGKVVICHPHNVDGIFKQKDAPILLSENASEYIAILNDLFNSKDKIFKIKNKVEIYIDEYNQIVESGFEKAVT